MNRLLAVLALPSLLGVAPPAVADDVHLANGQVFEDVIARRVGEQVRIRMAHGEMAVPASWVVKIEESETVLARYLERKAALEPGAGADQWLELARWARSHGFAEGAREAGLRAAALDPRLDGLAPILQAAGLTFHEESGSWLTEEALMVRRGFVRVGTEWLPAAVVAEGRRAAEEERLAAARSAREARLDQAITLLALSQLQEAQEDRAEAATPVVYPVAVFPGTFHPRPPHRPHPHPRPPHHGPPGHGGEHHQSGFSYEALAGRQPGSIIPVSVDPGAARGKHD